MNESLEKDFHSLFDMNYYVDIRGLPEFVSGIRQNNHVEFVYKWGENYKKATLSHFPHLGYILDDLEIKSVVPTQKKVTVYE
ncbi:hypothetical protein D3C87_325290 [compost metagenome]